MTFAQKHPLAYALIRVWLLYLALWHGCVMIREFAQYMESLQ